jgi:pectate lyase
MPGTGTKAGGAIGLALVVVALAAGASVLFLAPTLVSSTATTTPTPTASPSPPLAGGVPVDQNEGTGGGSGTGVVPFVTGAYLSQDRLSVTVYTFVPTIQEADGTCTASVVSGSEAERAESAASIDIAGTTCAPVTIVLDSPATRGLEVVVAYSSPTSQGRSEPTGVTEP